MLSSEKIIRMRKKLFADQKINGRSTFLAPVVSKIKIFSKF
jgi:hypothetical protein